MSKRKTIDACDRLFNFKINVIIDDYMPKIETQYDNKKELWAYQMRLEMQCLIFILTLGLFLS